MVYRGKPSPACGECRKRRSRCDQTVPACGQCIKAKRKCPGYRNTADLMFFDESKQVVERSKTSKFIASQQSSTELRAVPHYVTHVQLNPVSLEPMLDNFALNYLMSRQIGKTAVLSQFSYLPDVYLREGYYRKELHQSLTAIGLLGYLKSTRRPDLLQMATKSYIAAVRAVNDALSHPRTAVKEATLVSVMMLAMFEVMISPRVGGLANLSKHLRGALSVISQCLKQEPPSEIQRKLMKTIIQSVLMDALLQHTPLPPDYFLVKREIEAELNTNPLHARFLNALTDTLKSRDDFTMGKVGFTMSAGLRLDSLWEQFMEDMPENRQFKVLPAPKEYEEMVFGGFYHGMLFFGTNMIIKILKRSSISREVHSTYVEQLSYMPDPLSTNGAVALSRNSLLFKFKAEVWHERVESDQMKAQLRQEVIKSQAIINTLAKDVCASIPHLADFFIHLPSFTEEWKKVAATEGPDLLALSIHFAHEPPTFQSDDETSSSFIHDVSDPGIVYNMLYCLYVVAYIPFLPDEMRQWVGKTITIIEGRTDPDELALIKAMLSHIIRYLRTERPVAKPYAASQDSEVP